MKHAFEVTGHGLQVDKVQIKPGSGLLLSGKPPAHWSRFGTYHALEDDAFEDREMLVGSPGGATMDNERVAAIKEAIAGLDKDKDYTKGGKPEVDAINALMPEGAEPVTADERDAVVAKAD